MSAPEAAAPGRGRAFWLGAAVGAAGIAWGVNGLLSHSRDTRPTNFAKFFLGLVVVHDALFAPAVLAGGVLLARLVRGRARALVQAGLLIAASAALLAYPEVRDFAKVNHNPTSLPYDYTANLLGVVGVVTAAIAAIGLAPVVRRRVRRARAAPPAPPPPQPAAPSAPPPSPG